MREFSALRIKLKTLKDFATKGKTIVIFRQCIVEEQSNMENTRVGASML